MGIIVSPFMNVIVSKKRKKSNEEQKNSPKRKKKHAESACRRTDGEARGIRTPDPLYVKQLLSR